MLQYSIKSAFRNVFRFKTHTIFSLLGLTISLGCVFVITAWTIQELQYDRFHNQPESIYMATVEMKDNTGNVITFPETPTILAQELKNKIPGLKSFHLLYLYGKRILQSGNNDFEETGVATDSKMFELLNFPLIEGDISLLNDPDAIFISETLAKKLFPAETAIGKVVTYGKEKALTVRGVIKDIPENSSLKFDFIVPYKIEMPDNPSWWPLSDATFIKIAKNTDIADTKQLASTIWRENVSGEQYNINFIPITRLRYGANFEVFNSQHGNYLKLYSFFGIALLILILASLNYSHLLSSYAVKRAREVGIRKVNGASSNNILNYFLLESVINSIIASTLAIFLSELFIHLFQTILDVNVDSKYLVISYISGTIGSLLVVGIISGLYPALIARSFPPFSKATKNNPFQDQNKLRNVFILSQFILSITLSISSLIIIRQTNFLNKFDVGYDSHNIVKMYLPPEGTKDFGTIKNNLLSDSNIEQVSFASASPVNLSPFFATKNWEWEGLPEVSETPVYRLFIDNNFLDVFQIPLSRGRGFLKADKDKVIINEKLAALMGFNDPIGKILSQGESKFEIIGVVKDFHFQNLSNKIQPFLFMYNDTKNRMFVKVKNTEPGLNVIKKQYTQFYDQPFSYSFVDDELKEQYINENKISHGIVVFTILAIILSCIGLIGMVMFSTESKTKEIGVRKVCGAKITEILILLNKDIIKWFLVGFIASCIFSWIIMTRWLENFAFRIPLRFWILIAGASIIMLIAALTVSLQTWKAATKNPVDSLKYE